MAQHSNTSPAVALAKQLYNEDANKVKPTWDQLAAYGATQSMWIARAEKLMSLSEMSPTEFRSALISKLSDVFTELYKAEPENNYDMDGAREYWRVLPLAELKVEYDNACARRVSAMLA